jgi:hypothetical protein
MKLIYHKNLKSLLLYSEFQGDVIITWGNTVPIRRARKDYYWYCWVHLRAQAVWGKVGSSLDQWHQLNSHGEACGHSKTL